MKPLIKPVRHGLVAGSTGFMFYLLAAIAFLLSASVVFPAEATQSGLQLSTNARTATKRLCCAKSDRVVASQTTAKQIITGSHIPTSAKRMGHTADTPYPIYIIDTKDIARSGAGSVSEALRRCPAAR